MTRKLALTLALVMLGLASWNAAIDMPQANGDVRTAEGGIPRPVD